MVGYIEKVASGDVLYTPVTVPMVGVGVNTVAIGDIVFDGIDTGDSLQIFGNDGNVATELFKTRKGWEDDEDEDAGDWVFIAGDSFWMTPANEEDVTMTFPGEVKSAALEIVAKGDVLYTPFGNGTPAPVCISDIVFDGIDTGDSLQIFDNAGNVAKELFKTRKGWEDDEDEDASDWVFQPGDSFWITPANEEDITVSIPQPTL